MDVVIGGAGSLLVLYVLALLFDRLVVKPGLGLYDKGKKAGRRRG
jgi:hypothetical protein